MNKKSYKLYLFLVLFLMVGQLAYPQGELVFYESFGEPVQTANKWPKLSEYTDFDNTNPVVFYCYNDKADVRSTSPSENYDDASGGGSVLLSTDQHSLVIENIDINNYKDLSLSFGIRKANNATDGSFLLLTVEIDGVDMGDFSLDLPTGAGTTGWHKVSFDENHFVLGSTMKLIFINTNPESHIGTHLRIDDVEIRGSSTLPIVLENFDVEMVHEALLFTWETSSEGEMSHFEIEYSYDAKIYHYLRTVKAMNETLGYDYDCVVLQSIFEDLPKFFRLKSVEFTGVFTYSKIVELLTDGIIKEDVKMPNYFHQNDLWQLPVNDQQATIVVYNILGQIVLREDNYQQIPMALFKSGHYYMLIKNKGTIVQHPFVVR